MRRGCVHHLHNSSNVLFFLCLPSGVPLCTFQIQIRSQSVAASQHKATAEASTHREQEAHNVCCSTMCPAAHPMKAPHQPKQQHSSR